jgi:hypothetical protein
MRCSVSGEIRRKRIRRVTSNLAIFRIALCSTYFQDQTSCRKLLSLRQVHSPSNFGVVVHASTSVAVIGSDESTSAAKNVTAERCSPRGEASYLSPAGGPMAGARLFGVGYPLLALSVPVVCKWRDPRVQGVGLR